MVCFSVWNKYFWREACCMVSLLAELKNDAFVPFLMHKSLKNGG